MLNPLTNSDIIGKVQYFRLEPLYSEKVTSTEGVESKDKIKANLEENIHGQIDKVEDFHRRNTLENIDEIIVNPEPEQLKDTWTVSSHAVNTDDDIELLVAPMELQSPENGTSLSTISEETITRKISFRGLKKSASFSGKAHQTSSFHIALKGYKERPSLPSTSIKSNYISPHLNGKSFEIEKVSRNEIPSNRNENSNQPNTPRQKNSKVKLAIRSCNAIFFAC